MCSYCGCRNIPLIARLTEEHEDIGNSTSALTSALRADDPEAAALAAKEFAELMHPHTRLEERGLFAEMRKDEMFTEHIDSLCAEHGTIDSELDDIIAGDLSRIQPLLTLLSNHIDKEENGLFPSALVYLDNEQWDYLQQPAMLEEPPSPTSTTAPTSAERPRPRG
jgi:hemerythrin-like domain-containing protein